jgi:hypothetical protein
MMAVSATVRLETLLPREQDLLKVEASRLARAVGLDVTVRLHESGRSCTARFTRRPGL